MMYWYNRIGDVGGVGLGKGIGNLSLVEYLHLDFQLNKVCIMELALEDVWRLEMELEI